MGIGRVLVAYDEKKKKKHIPLYAKNITRPPFCKLLFIHIFTNC